jgi:peptidoglycan/LPS O-acetylase OafA/YrhL
MLSASPKRFYLLDVLRGFAALSVVLWHWNHFFMHEEPGRSHFLEGQQPFFRELSLAYSHGYGAVELFFCLSGFVFFWLYQGRIRQKRISFANFSILRLARLYPLHFATLVLVLVLQSWHHRLTGRFFVYDLNDVRHFALNLFFASSWGFDKDYFSFNGPVWSVSVEMLLYGLFFVVCRLGAASNLMLFALSFGGGSVLLSVNLPLADGVASFFMGGLALRIYESVATLQRKGWTCAVVSAVAVVGWACVIHYSGNGPGSTGAAFGWAVRLFPIYVLYPLTLVALSLIDTCWPIGRRICLIGDISYSVYLIHFPLQLVSAVAFAEMGLSSRLYLSHGFFFGFFVVLITLSIVSHKYFEMPVQRWLRSWESRQLRGSALLQ